MNIKTQSPEIDIKTAKKELVKSISSSENTLAEYNAFENSSEIEYQKIDYTDFNGEIAEAMLILKIVKI